MCYQFIIFFSFLQFSSQLQIHKSQSIHLNSIIYMQFNFGALIIGPSGSGKSTLTAALQDIYTNLDIPTLVINLDFANQSNQKYQANIDINDLICIQDVMDEFQIGPNAAMLYCMEFLEKNIDWLTSRITQFKNHFLIIDLPGQIELYVNHQSLKGIISQIKKIGFQLCIVELFDSTYIYELKHFLSMCLMSLTTMINFQLPHINVLSKVDIMKGRSPGGDLYDYLNVPSTTEMVEMLNIKEKDESILKAISKLIDSYGLVSFLPLAIKKIQFVSRLIFQIQKAVGSLYSRQSNKKFKVLLQKFYKDLQYHHQQLLIQLENEIFGEMEDDDHYLKFFNDHNSQKN